MNPLNWHAIRITADIRRQRQADRTRCRELMAFLIEPASVMANQFDEEEMWVLWETYQRLSWQEWREIDPLAADTQCDCETYTGALSQILASKLCQLGLAERDHRFTLRWEQEQGWSDKVVELADKVRILSVAEACALHLTLECVRTIPAACFNRELWWHPFRMMRLLADPALDLPPHRDDEVEF